MKLKRICPICDSNDGDILYEGKRAIDKREKVLSNFNIVACSKCGFIFEDSNYTQKDYDEHYKSLKSQSSSVGRGGVSKFDIDRYDFQIKQIENFLENKDASILDIGCGYGGLLLRLEEKGYKNIYGIEIEENCCRILEKNNIQYSLGTVFDMEKINKSFDVVIISHVLEHIYDLKKIKSIINKVLNKNGILYIEVPDTNNYSNFNYKPFDYFNFEHLNHFTQNTLNILFNKFNIIHSGNSYIHRSQFSKMPILFSIYKNNKYNIIIKDEDDINKDEDDINKDEDDINKIKEYIAYNQNFEKKFKFDNINYNELFYIWGFGVYGRHILMQENIMKNINIVGILDKNPTFKDFKIKIYNGNEIPMYIIEDNNIDFLLNKNNINIIITTSVYENEIKEFILKNKNFYGKVIIAAEQSRAEQSTNIR